MVLPILGRKFAHVSAFHVKSLDASQPCGHVNGIDGICEMQRRSPLLARPRLDSLGRASPGRFRLREIPRDSPAGGRGLLSQRTCQLGIGRPGRGESGSGEGFSTRSVGGPAEVTPSSPVLASRIPGGYTTLAVPPARLRSCKDPGIRGDHPCSETVTATVLLSLSWAFSGSLRAAWPSVMPTRWRSAARRPISACPAWTARPTAWRRSATPRSWSSSSPATTAPRPRPTRAASSSLRRSTRIRKSPWWPSRPTTPRRCGWTSWATATWATASRT